MDFCPTRSLLCFLSGSASSSYLLLSVCSPALLVLPRKARVPTSTIRHIPFQSVKREYVRADTGEYPFHYCPLGKQTRESSSRLFFTAVCLLLFHYTLHSTLTFLSIRSQIPLPGQYIHTVTYSTTTSTHPFVSTQPSRDLNIPSISLPQQQQQNDDRQRRNIPNPLLCHRLLLHGQTDRIPPRPAPALEALRHPRGPVPGHQGTGAEVLWGQFGAGVCGC